jgi:DNA repair protein RadC
LSVSLIPMGLDGGHFTLYYTMEAVKQHTVTEITVAYRNKQKAAERPLITQSADALVHLLDGYNRDILGLQEQFVVLYLNVSNRVLGVYRCSTGGITGTICEIRLILGVALKIAATSMIISHNHPSGNLKPSRADEELTRKLKEAGKVMDIRLMDHVIVEPSGTQYYSFADEGLI